MFQVNRLTAFAVLSLVACLAASAESHSFRDAAAKAALTPLVGAKATAKQYEDVAEKVEVDKLMELFKPSAKGGYGVDPTAAGKNDSIDLKLGDLGRKALTPAQVKSQAAGLDKMVQVVVAIAEVNHYYAKKFAPKADLYDKLNTEMKKTAEDLAKAVKGGNPTEIKAAANKVTGSCSDCHEKFRN